MKHSNDATKCPKPCPLRLENINVCASYIIIFSTRMEKSKNVHASFVDNLQLFLSKYFEVVSLLLTLTFPYKYTSNKMFLIKRKLINS